MFRLARRHRGVERDEHDFMRDVSWEKQRRGKHTVLLRRVGAVGSPRSQSGKSHSERLLSRDELVWVAPIRWMARRGSYRQQSSSDAAADDPRAEPFVGNVARWYADQPDHGPDLPAISCRPLSAARKAPATTGAKNSKPKTTTTSLVTTLEECGVSPDIFAGATHGVRRHALRTSVPSSGRDLHAQSLGRGDSARSVQPAV